jgi:hypothetical protein
MFQMIRFLLAMPGDRTEMWLLSINRYEHDILMRKELETLSALHPGPAAISLSLSLSLSLSVCVWCVWCVCVFVCVYVYTYIYVYLYIHLCVFMYI